MKNAYIISTGTELLLGDTLDSNGHFISEGLSRLGYRVLGRSTVGDNPEMMRRAFKTGFEAADLVISSGGLGPTSDDLTREIGSEVLGLPLVRNDVEMERIRDYFARRRRHMPASNEKQSLFPAEASVLINDRGSASGFIAVKDGKYMICLPGPPREMEPMFREQVEPFLIEAAGAKGPFSYAYTLRFMGPGESQVEEIIAPAMKDPNGCALALLAKEGEVHVRISRQADTAETARAVVSTIIDEIRKLGGNNIYGEESTTLAETVIALLRHKQCTVATAESCTGGLLGKMLTDVAGSSDVYWGGAVSYSNQAKSTILGVSEDTLTQYGAVSAETAAEMAQGVKKLARTDYGISMTGIAGPGGGSETKPVGLVFLGLAGPDGVETKELRFLGGRDAVRNLTAKCALDWLRRKAGAL